MKLFSICFLAVASIAVPGLAFSQQTAKPAEDDFVIHPDFMDAAMPLACLPVEIAGRNRMMRALTANSFAASGRCARQWACGRRILLLSRASG